MKKSILCALMFAACACLLTLPGCGGGDKPTPEAASAPDVSRLGDLVTDLDGGRLSLRGPKGWKQMPRGKHEIRFSNQEVEGESVSVTVANDEFNVGTLTLEKAKELKDEIGKKGNAVMVGNLACVAWEVKLSAGAKQSSRALRIATIQKGRLYTFEFKAYDSLYNDTGILQEVVKSAEFGEPTQFGTQPEEEAQEVNSDFSVDFNATTEDAATEEPVADGGE